MQEEEQQPTLPSSGDKSEFKLRVPFNDFEKLKKYLWRFLQVASCKIRELII